MKSILRVSRELKKLDRQFEYIIVYGAGVWGRYCKEMLDNCHIDADCFAITQKEGRVTESVDNLPVFAMSDFPFHEHMTTKNTLFIVAVSEKFVDEVCSNLKSVLGDEAHFYIYSREIKRPYVGITTVAGCRLNCAYCPQDVFLKNYYSGKEPVSKLDFTEYKKILANIPNEVQINFAGFSEPFLNNQCREMILHTAKKGHYIQIFTTLVGLTKEIIEDVFEYADFILHLPGEDETNITVDESYIECLKLLFEKNRTNRRILYISAPGGGDGISSKLACLIPSDVVIDTYCMDRAGNVEQGMKFECTGSLTCERSFSRLDQNVLLPNGDLILCCQDWGLRYILGNLKESTYIDILESEAADKIREEMAAGEDALLCRKCNYALALTE